MRYVLDSVNDGHHGNFEVESEHSSWQYQLGSGIAATRVMPTKNGL
jgi:hypothetical protein